MSSSETRILVLPPTPTDGALTQRLLTQAGMTVALVPDLAALIDEMRVGCGALLLTEETVLHDGIDSLGAAVSKQPFWSDLPVVLLVEGGASSPAAIYALERLGNVLLLEFPVRVNTLVSTMRVALRDRKRQYQARRYQAELLQQAEALWRSNKELEQFAYVSSHDLKEPLRKIVNYAQLLESRFRGELGEDGDKYLHMISDGAERMRNLIESLLAFSRLSKTEQRIEPVDLNAVMADVLNDIEFSIQEANATIEVSPLPVVNANALQMHQLLQNLVANGIKFIDGKAPRLRVSAEERKEEWRICVEDNGIGIEPEYRERIFNVFSRLHGRGRYPGTGIGLAICKKIVEMHGGRIWVEPAEGGGSRFIFTLSRRLTHTSRENAEERRLSEMPQPALGLR